MKRTPKQAAMGAVMDEHSNLRHYVEQLERGEMRRADGTAYAELERDRLIVRLRELQAENRDAYNWLRRVSEAGDPSSLPEVGVVCLEKLRTLLARLGVATTPSIEEFGATLETHLMQLVRVVNQFVDSTLAKPIMPESNEQTPPAVEADGQAQHDPAIKSAPFDSEVKQ